MIISIKSCNHKEGLNMNQQTKINFILYIKIIACFMIINSHCRNIYPFSYLAIGGGFGNSLFFIMSGYLLIHIKDGFFVWYSRRLIRIIKPLFFIIIIDFILLSLGLFEIGISGDLLVFFLNKYWFAFAILIYYFLYYFIFKKYSDRKNIIIAFGYISVYLWYYLAIMDLSTFSIELEGFSLIKVYFYFCVFCIGGIIRYHQTDICRVVSRKKGMLLCVVFAFLFACGWAIEYALMEMWSIGYVLQILIHICVFGFACCVLLFFIIYDKDNENIISKSKVLNYIANSTLEIYLVQVTFVNMISRLLFPINFVIFVVVSIVGGCSLHYIISLFYIKLNKSRFPTDTFK